MALTKQEILKMTVPKLREEAMKIENISGVHGMNKSTLIEVLFEVNGIEIEKKRKAVDKQAKVKVKDLQQKRIDATHAGDKKAAKILQRKAHRLKRSTRVN